MPDERSPEYAVRCYLLKEHLKQSPVVTPFVRENAKQCSMVPINDTDGAANIILAMQRSIWLHMYQADPGDYHFGEYVVTVEHVKINVEVTKKDNPA